MVSITNFDLVNRSDSQARFTFLNFIYRIIKFCDILRPTSSVAVILMLLMVFPLEKETTLTRIKIGTAVAFPVFFLVIIIISIVAVFQAKSKRRRRGTEYFLSDELYNVFDVKYEYTI